MNAVHGKFFRHTFEEERGCGLLSVVAICIVSGMYCKRLQIGPVIRTEKYQKTKYLYLKQVKV